MTTDVRIEIVDASAETSVAPSTATGSANETFNGGADSAAVLSPTEPADPAVVADNGGPAPGMASPVPAGPDITTSWIPEGDTQESSVLRGTSGCCGHRRGGVRMGEHDVGGLSTGDSGIKDAQ